MRRQEESAVSQPIVLGKEKQYFGLKRGEKSVWEAVEYLNTD